MMGNAKPSALRAVIDPFIPAWLRRARRSVRTFQQKLEALWLALLHEIVMLYRRETTIPKFREHYYGKKMRLIAPTVRRTKEVSNFTYDLTDRNLRYLGEMLSIATRRPAAEIHAYIQEAIRDTTLNDYFQARMAMHPDAKTSPEVRSPFGRRLGWYAIARAVKPRVIIETGVERGHGSLILCAALLRNKAAGHEGRYYGTDINPISGFLLGDVYASVGKIVYGDSIETLKAFPDSVDLFINDSDHSAEYEAAEYAVIASKLAGDAVILGDNAHVTDKLAIFAQDTGRNFLFFKEEPEKHWYPGAGIGIAFPRY